MMQIAGSIIFGVVSFVVLLPQNAFTRLFHMSSEQFNSPGTTNIVWQTYQVTNPSLPSITKLSSCSFFNFCDLCKIFESFMTLIEWFFSVVFVYCFSSFSVLWTLFYSLWLGLVLCNTHFLQALQFLPLIDFGFFHISPKLYCFFLINCMRFSKNKLIPDENIIGRNMEEL